MTWFAVDACYLACVRCAVEYLIYFFQCEKQPAHLDHTHILMTYSALCCLTTLGDDFSRLDRSGLLRGLHHLQMKNGGWEFNAPFISANLLSFQHKISSQDRELCSSYFWCVGCNTNISQIFLPVARFRASLEDNSESDLKFAYCAVCICYILGEFRHIDVDRLCHYIKQCQVSSLRLSKPFVFNDFFLQWPFN